MNTKTHIKQENKGRTKRSDITLIVNTIYEKKMKQGPTPETSMNKKTSSHIRLQLTQQPQTQTWENTKEHIY